jgi:hypothetical protein
MLFVIFGMGGGCWLCVGDWVGVGVSGVACSWRILSSENKTNYLLSQVVSCAFIASAFTFCLHQRGDFSSRHFHLFVLFR